MNLVVMPIYNEAKTVMKVIEGIREYYHNDIVAVDDGSTDSTPTILKKSDLTHIISHKRNIGYGGALISGINYGIKKKYKYLLTIDADGQHDPCFIPTFFEEVKEYDIVSGTRYTKKNSNVPPILENSKNINQNIVEFINLEFKINITDAFCGFKAYQVDKLSKLYLTVKDHAFPLQLWVQAVFNKLRIKEVAVPLIPTTPRRNYDEILGSVDDTIEYFKTIILAEVDILNRNK